MLYADLREIAHRQLLRLGGNPTLQTTAIVNEAYLKLKKSSGHAYNSAHFLAIIATAMRHVVIDYARTRRAEKRGGGAAHVELEECHASVEAQAEELLALNDAIQNLSALNPRLVKIFECKFFSGLNDQETADALGISKRTAQRDWRKAKAFLSEFLVDHQ